MSVSANSDPSVDLVSWMNSRAAALSRVSVDVTPTVVVRVQLCPGRLTLDLSKHLLILDLVLLLTFASEIDRCKSNAAIWRRRSNQTYLENGKGKVG
jgi:hypothetical protein